MKRTYTCAACGGQFQKVGTDDRANDEALANFGTANASSDPNMAEVCDDCYREFMEWLRSRKSQN